MGGGGANVVGAGIGRVMRFLICDPNMRLWGGKAGLRGKDLL